MREDFWQFQPTHTLIMATNHKPKIRGTDNGIWRRLKLVPFTVTVDSEKADLSMPEKLRAEYPGILAWCVRGCLAWQAANQKLVEPALVVDATKEYRDEQDILGNFIAECCDVAPYEHKDKMRVSAQALYFSYKQWAESSGEVVASQTVFGTRLRERGFDKRQSNGIKYFGIQLKKQSPPQIEDDDDVVPF